MAANGERFHSVTYDEWQQGNTFKSIRRLSANNKQYQSINMQVYDTGQLGTRPWLRSWDTWTTGLTLTDTIDNRTWVQWRPTNQYGQLWIGTLSGDVAYYDFSTETFAYLAGADTYVVNNDWHAYYWDYYRDDWESNGTLIGSQQHALMPLDNWLLSGEAKIDSANAVTNVTWADGTAHNEVNFTWYRDRIYAWTWPDNLNDPANRIFYTDAGSYTTSSAGNYFDIGASSDGYWIIGCWPIRDSLLIAMSNGDWYSFVGPDPDSGSLRFVGNYVTPSTGAAAVPFNNALYFCSPRGDQVCVATPSGVDTESFAHVRPWIEDVRWTLFHDYRALASAEQQAVELHVVRNVTDQWWAGIEFVNQAWVYHGYGKTGFSTELSNMGYLRDCATVGHGQAYAFLVEDPDSPNSTEVHIYTRDIVLNRPSKSTDFWSDKLEVAVGDTATGTADGMIRLAPFSPEPGQEVRIKEVTVDFVYWYDSGADYLTNVGSAGTYYTTPSMRCLAIDGAVTGLDSIDTFSAAALTTFEARSFVGDTVHGMPARWIFRFPPEDNDYRQTAQVQLDNLLSVAIDRIIVKYDIRPTSHWNGQIGGT